MNPTWEAFQRHWDEKPFETALAASFLLHLLAWGAAYLAANPWRLTGEFPSIVVDLNAPFRPRQPWDTRLPGSAKGAPAPAPKPVPGVTGPAQPEKQWVLPGPKTQTLEKPPEETAAPAAVGGAPAGSGPGGEGGLGGTGGGTGTGDAIVDRPPRLVNGFDIRSDLKRYYPEGERRLGRQGRVLAAIAIGADGRVFNVEILDSAGEAFDEAARTVARRMIFEPALIRSVPTAVTVRQTIVFRLDD